MSGEGTRVRVGIFDHTGSSLGGATLVAAHLASLFSRFYTVDLIRDWSGFSLEQLSSSFSLDLRRVAARPCDAMWESFAVPGSSSFREQLRRSRSLTSPYDLFIYSGLWSPPFCYAKRGLIYCHFPIHLPNAEIEKNERWMRRNALDRSLRVLAYRLVWKACLNGYDRILANSAFTAGWIERRWGVRSEVVFPPIDLEVPAVEKQNRIVSVGRFFGLEPRCKGHHLQTAAFREFLAKAREPWELCMIGSCLSENDRAYLSAIREAARDLPIRFLVNVDRATVLDTLARAKIFWHTAGQFADKNENPVFAEHFGMATVEAMRAGCVPIVLHSGGQREIVQNDLSGFLCDTTDELVEKSLGVAQSVPRLRSLAAAATRRSMDLSGEIFDRRILEIANRAFSQRRNPFAMQGILNALARTTRATETIAGQPE
jgi:L-malate glycosyltransferase